MSTSKTKTKNRASTATNQACESTAGTVINFLKSDTFATLVKELLEAQFNDFKAKISSLEKEVYSLRQSNTELAKLVSSGSSQLANVNDNLYDYSNDTVLSDDSVFNINVQINRKKNGSKTDSANFTPKYKKQTKERQAFQQNKYDDLDVVGSCCDEKNKDIPFTGAARKIWLYVDRCEAGVKPEHVNEYLNRRCPGKNFVVEPVRQNEFRPSFRVGAQPELEPVLRQPTFWPKDIIVRRFKFFRTNPKAHRLEPRNVNF